jgi:Tol biopolymer transport system component
MEIPSPHGKPLPPKKFISSTRSVWLPRFSPDGKKIAFLSERSGSREFWICDSDGSNQVRLTLLGKGGDIGFGILWSPDSSRLTFHWESDLNREVYVINANGGSPRRLTTTNMNVNPMGSGNPSWSRDGCWIFFDVAEKGGAQVCKVPAEGGPVVKLILFDGFAPIESPDGRYIYYRADVAGIYSYYKIPIVGGKAQRVFDSLVEPCCVDDGFYFIPMPVQANDYSIQFLNTATGSTQRIATIGNPISDFTLSPDRRWLLYSQTDQAGSDLMLVENFK